MIYLNGKAIPHLEEIKYLKASMVFNWTKLKVKKVFIDIGQEGSNKHFISDERGNGMEFSSDIDVINFVAKEGFELIQINDTANESGLPTKEMYFKKIL